MTIDDTLQQFGLTQKETAVYLAALELGESLVLPLAKHAQIKRSALYEAFPRLETLGLISYGRKGKRRTVIAQSPAALIAVQEQRLADLRLALPELAAHFNALASKPKVFAYEGVEGIKRVYEDTLHEGFPLLSFLQAKEIDPGIADWLLKSYIPRRVKQRIYVKNLVSGLPQESEWILFDKGGYRENRYVDHKLFPANIEVLIYSNKVAYITFKTGGQPMGIIVESGDVAETMRSFHKMAWEFAGKDHRLDR